ncbi:hypothetical protein R0131_17770 [Clostridium sp. AL.422]|uniref:hypothetical protein n=1 Tax=Clostridium TaxID=1485 RepID=UPI00293DFC58|nr:MULTISPECIES: hypothetical protein [unclassified Clostridium]MDV4152679.1 hypothetical protein [Clostridium sp. AL.422]
MRYIIFILLILGIAFIYFYYNRKLEIIKKQLILTRKQYSAVRNKYDTSKKSIGSLSVKFSIPTYKGGTLKANSYIYLSPYISSDILNCMKFNTEIGILDCAELNNETWFYINIPSSNSINNRGWVNSKDISIFYSTSSSVAKAN